MAFERQLAFAFDCDEVTRQALPIVLSALIARLGFTPQFVTMEEMLALAGRSLRVRGSEEGFSFVWETIEQAVGRAASDPDRYTVTDHTEDDGEPARKH